MSVLSNSELVKAIETGRLIIKPRPSPGSGEPDTPYDTCSVQLHIDDFLMVPKDTVKLNFDLGRSGDFQKRSTPYVPTPQFPKKGLR